MEQVNENEELYGKCCVCGALMEVRVDDLIPAPVCTPTSYGEWGHAEGGCWGFTPIPIGEFWGYVYDD